MSSTSLRWATSTSKRTCKANRLQTTSLRHLVAQVRPMGKWTISVWKITRNSNLLKSNRDYSGIRAAPRVIKNRKLKAKLKKSRNGKWTWLDKEKWCKNWGPCEEVTLALASVPAARLPEWSKVSKSKVKSVSCQMVIGKIPHTNLLLSTPLVEEVNNLKPWVKLQSFAKRLWSISSKKNCKKPRKREKLRKFS
jgi:hypothetical protein